MLPWVVCVCLFWLGLLNCLSQSTKVTQRRGLKRRLLRHKNAHWTVSAIFPQICFLIAAQGAWQIYSPILGPLSFFTDSADDFNIFNMGMDAPPMPSRNSKYKTPDRAKKALTGGQCVHLWNTFAPRSVSSQILILSDVFGHLAS